MSTRALKAVEEISLLYELALSVGASAEAEEVCRSFLRTLQTRKNLDYAAVWVREPEMPDRFRLIHARPSVRSPEPTLHSSHPLIRHAFERGAFSLVADSAAGAPYAVEQGLGGGIFAVFPLAETGVLKVYSSVRTDVFGEREMKQLAPVLQRFGMALRGSLAAEHLRHEVEKRRQLAAEAEKTALLSGENPNPVLRIDETLQLSYANRAAEALLEQITGSKEILPSAWRRLTELALESASPEQSEIEVKSRWFSLLFVPVVAARYVNVYGFDTTDLRLTQAELAETKSFFEQVLNAMPAQLAVFDPSARYEYITPSAISDPDLREWLIGKTDVDYCTYRGLDPTVGARRMETIRRGTSERKEFRFEESFKDRFGQHRHFLRIVTPVFDTAGQVAHVLGYGLDITELRSATQALVESEDRWRRLVDFHPDPLLVTRRMEILFWNRAAAVLFGTGDLKGRSLPEFFAQEDQSILDARQDTLDAGQHTELREYRLIRPDGSERYVEGFSVPVMYEGVRAAQSVLRDITDRKAAELQLRRSEELKAAVISTALDGVVMMDDRGMVVDWNPAAEAIFGYHKEQAMGRRVAELIIPKAMHAAHDTGMDHYLRTGEGPVLGRRIELSAVRADGSEFPVELAITAVHHEAESPVFTAYIRDISARRRAEAALRESEARYKDLVESAADGIYRVSANGRLMYLNPVAMRELGLEQYEPGKESLWSFVSEEARSEVAEFYTTQIREGVERTYCEFAMVDAGGRRFWVGQSVQLIRENGEIVALQGVARDITRRREAEESLREARIAAETSMRARERFLANMSHEMRTPLNAVIGMTHLLTATNPTPKQQAYLGGIKYSADNLLALINDLLDVAKIESGRVDFEEIPFRPAEILQRVTEAVSFRADEKGVQIDYASSPELPPVVVGDPVRLNQILLNLASNAVKFTHQGRVSLSAAPARISGDEVRIVFVVSDTGIGIPREKLDVIFDVFAQASSDTTRRYGGTGLGLSIVKQLTEMQGGSVHVESREGKGSAFSVILPFRLADAEALERAPDEATSADISGARILLVEDNEMNQFVTTDMLTGWGATVDVADNGRVAVEKLRERVYDLVLMDIQMPEMDGYEATRIIRRELGIGADTLPIVALTASVLLEQRARMEECGMNDVVFKPFDPYTLRRRIAHHIGSTRRISGNGARAAAHMKSTAESGEGSPARAIDLGVLREASAGRLEVARKIIDLFLQQAPEQLTAIDRAVETGDRNQVEFVAHKLKSSAALMGIESLASELRELERGAHLDPYEALRARVNRAQEIAARALAELLSERRTLG